MSSFQKKNDQTAFELRCTSQNVYVKLYVLNHIVLSSILYKFPRKALFSIFIKSCIFFSIYTILNKLNQGQYGWTHTGWPILPFLKKWSIFVKSTYGSDYVVFSNISRNFRSRYNTVLTILSFQELYISFNQKLFFSTSNIS